MSGIERNIRSFLLLLLSQSDDACKSYYATSNYNFASALLDALDTLASEVEETRMCGTSGRQGRRAGKEKVVGGGKRVIKTAAFPRRLYHGMQAEKERERRKRDRQSDSLCRRQHPMVFPSPLSFSYLPLSVCEFVSLALLTTRKVCQLNKFCASNEI